MSLATISGLLVLATASKCLRRRCVCLLMGGAAWICGCSPLHSPFVDRDRTVVATGSPSQDWVAAVVESSRSFQSLADRYSHIRLRYRTLWHPGWMADEHSASDEVVRVDLYSPSNELSSHRWATIRVHRSGEVEREETALDGENVWARDRY